MSLAMNEHVAKSRPPATYQDVLDAPPHMVAELSAARCTCIRGRRSATASRPRRWATKSVAPFHKGRGGPGGWWILDEPELHFAADVLVPDLAGWRRERMPEFPDVPWSVLAPDWVCEVLTPCTRRIDLTDKRRIYAATGVAHLWLVDPTARDARGLRAQGRSLDPDRRLERQRGGTRSTVRRDRLSAFGALARLEHDPEKIIPSFPSCSKLQIGEKC